MLHASEMSNIAMAPAAIVAPGQAEAVAGAWPVANNDNTADFMDFRFQLSAKSQVVRAILNRGTDARFAYVVTPNVDHVVRIQHRRSDLWPAYRRAWMTLCDSRILARLASRAGLALPVVPGSDLTLTLFRKVIRPDDRVAILGGDAAAIDGLRAAYNLTDVVHYNPPMGFIEDAEEVALPLLDEGQVRVHHVDARHVLVAREAHAAIDQDPLAPREELP